jgi:hypothetical protein
MTIEKMNDINDSFINVELNKLGLETYIGCAGPLFESVRTEFGDQFLMDALRSISDEEAKGAVYYALVTNSII